MQILSRKDIENVIEAIEDALENDQKLAGICYYIKCVVGFHERKMQVFGEFAEQWDEYSGCSVYPIPYTQQDAEEEGVDLLELFCSYVNFDPDVEHVYHMEEEQRFYTVDRGSVIMMAADPGGDLELIDVCDREATYHELAYECLPKWEGISGERRNRYGAYLIECLQELLEVTDD